MHSRTSLTILSVASLLAPFAASAATITDLLTLASSVLNALIGLLITAAIVVFFWGLLQYLYNGNAEKKQEGIKAAMYGVVTIAIMVSIWGIIRLLQNTLKINSTDPIIPRGVIIKPTSY